MALERLNKILGQFKKEATQELPAIQLPPTPTYSATLEELGKWSPAIQLDRSKQRVTFQAGYLEPGTMAAIRELKGLNCPLGYEESTWIIPANIATFDDVPEQPLYRIACCANPMQLRLVSKEEAQDWVTILLEYDWQGLLLYPGQSRTTEIEVAIPQGNTYLIGDPKLSIRLQPPAEPAA